MCRAPAPAAWLCTFSGEGYGRPVPGILLPGLPVPGLFVPGLLAPALFVPELFVPGASAGGVAPGGASPIGVWPAGGGFGCGARGGISWGAVNEPASLNRVCCWIMLSTSSNCCITR